MTCGNLPADSHIAHISKSGGVSNNRVLPEAFKMRVDKQTGDQTEKELSANWLEKHGGNSIEENVARTRKRIIDKKILGLKRSEWFVTVSVKDIYDDLPDISVRHDPGDDDDSHSLVDGYTNEDDLVLVELSRLANKHPIIGALV